MGAEKTIIQKLLVFERKILRRIFGPTKENQIWRIKTNEELDRGACAILRCHLWPVRLYNILPHYLINGTIF